MYLSHCYEKCHILISKWNNVYILNKFDQWLAWFTLDILAIVWIQIYNYDESKYYNTKHHDINFDEGEYEITDLAEAFQNWNVSET